MTKEELLEQGKMHRPTAASFDKIYILVYEQIEKELREDEEVKYVISTGGIQRKNSSALFMGAIAITDKRLVYGGQIKGLLKNTYTSASLDINKVSSANTGYASLGTGAVTIETLAHDDIVVGFENREKATEYAREMMQVIDSIKAKTQPTGQTIVQEVSAADEIAKFKGLLDQGIISQEEFDAKKKQLLGI